MTSFFSISQALSTQKSHTTYTTIHRYYISQFTSIAHITIKITITTHKNHLSNNHRYSVQYILFQSHIIHKSHLFTNQTKDCISSNVKKHTQVLRHRNHRLDDSSCRRCLLQEGRVDEGLHKNSFSPTRSRCILCSEMQMTINWIYKCANHINSLGVSK